MSGLFLGIALFIPFYFTVSGLYLKPSVWQVLLKFLLKEKGYFDGKKRRILMLLRYCKGSVNNPKPFWMRPE